MLVTIWDSVNELSVDKLKKFAQYLVNELPKEYLPIAQRLLDQLKCPESEINQSLGAPDPTDGGHEQYLGTAQHPIAAEWLTVMKSLRAREPEGIWNLMAIVREMFARRDENAVSLLSILTVECLANCQRLRTEMFEKCPRSLVFIVSFTTSTYDFDRSNPMLSLPL
ncbi:hypothetical protein ANCDUO_02499 [Ancylostoma duodenale]|uniref:ZSWIM8 TPR repeats domain-containing protein n=1 Tax=Ancylostoma duodenale TaxID=51022 RepID=A0A0C2DBJ7_9BILA|nr:hypothetical protein ANCDUO_02499 [Ancylostoma duodenale]